MTCRFVGCWMQLEQFTYPWESGIDWSKSKLSGICPVLLLPPLHRHPPHPANTCTCIGAVM